MSCKKCQFFCYFASHSRAQAFEATIVEEPQFTWATAHYATLTVRLATTAWRGHHEPAALVYTYINKNRNRITGNGSGGDYMLSETM
jgi:hypothetical protein